MAIRLGRMSRALLLVVAVLLVGAISPRTAGAAPETRHGVDVLVPEAGNLQLLAFWVALGGGYFTREGIDVNVVTPSAPSAAEAAFKTGTPPVAILPGPAYERLIAQRFPFVVAASLLQGDPLQLIVNHNVAQRMSVAGASLHDRLNALRSASIGVASSDRARLYQLFRSQGIDANIAHIEIRKGEEQLGAFANGDIEAIYTETPYAERALVDDNGTVFFDGASGEVPAFSERLIQALAATRAFSDTRPGDLRALVRALANAEHLIRFEPKAAVAAALIVLPKSDAKHLTRFVAAYEHAIPATPHVEASLIERDVKLYPVGGERLDLAGVDLGSYVFVGETFPVEARRASVPNARNAKVPSRRHIAAALLLGLLALGIGLAFVFRDQREGLDGGEDVSR
jgi:ABC-type nitrate/sulfonate/bicarbonate transport system substrate-binding protein